jgi:hypothetical protein
MKKLFCAAFLLLILTINSDSQIRRTDTHTNGWGIYTGNFKLIQNTYLFTEYQYRRADFGKNWQQSLARIGIEQRLKNFPVSFTAGYGFIITYPYGKQPVAATFNEHRAWQQINLTHASGKFKFSHRYRLEQRWLEKKKLNSTTNEYESDGMNYLNRMRYRVFVSYSLWKKESEEKFNELQLQVYDEVFIAFGKNVLLNVFDQNRISCALSYSFSKKFSLFGGYLNQYIIKAVGITAENNHTIQTGVNLNF